MADARIPIIGAKPLSDHLPPEDMAEPTGEFREVIEQSRAMLEENPDFMFLLMQRVGAKDIYSLAVWRDDNHPSYGEQHITTILRAAFYHIEEQHIPSGAIVPPTENDASERAYAAFHVLLGMTYFIPEYSGFKDRFVQAWPSLYKWSQYLCTQRVEKGTDPQAIEIATSAISKVLVEWLREPALIRKIRSTPGIYRLMIRLWMHKNSAIIPTSHLLIKGIRPEYSVINEVVDAAGPDGATKIAKVSLKRLSDAIAPNPIRLDEVTCALGVICMLTREYPHRLSNAFLAEHVVYSVTKALVKISQVCKRQPSQELSDDFAMGIVLLSGTVLRTDGFTWVREALNGGLLQALCGFSSQFHTLMQDAKSAVEVMVASTIPKFLVYHSVVRALSREMEAIDKVHGDDDIRDSFVSDDWVELVGLGRRRDLLKGVKTSMKKSRACENINCNTLASDTVKLRRCAACLVVFYCTKDCQTKAWNGHKKMCRAKQDALRAGIEEGGVKMFSDSDADYLRALLLNDASVHLPHLRRLAAAKFPNENHPEHFVFSIDYTNPDYPGGTCSLKNILTYESLKSGLSGDGVHDEATDRFNEEMVKKARDHPKMFTFIEGTIPYGDGNQVRNVMMSPNLWSTAPRKLTALDWFTSKCEHGEPPGFFDVVNQMTDEDVEALTSQLNLNT